ncbi:isoamylase early set domain-containing protein [Candidatus Acetothermia bacterium]|nr:isoamylase early set domain-containing protein [Candidatus Acetothermia bacterium]
MIQKERVKQKDKHAITVTFTVPKDHPHKPLAVVGDFNNWDAMVNPFKKQRNGSYSATVALKAGQRYAFRYMCEGGNWCNDEAADDYEHNVFGGDNCIVNT